ncbi:hypothetical protein ACH4E7_15525 [Kitasatospora sp. NPDC018058]
MFSTFAGPVRVNGVGTCVWETVTASDPNGGLYISYSTPSHSC